MTTEPIERCFARSIKFFRDTMMQAFNGAARVSGDALRRAGATDFRSDQSGSVIILFGAALIVVLGFVGGAVDYLNAYRTRNALQNSLDAAVLAAGVAIQSGESESVAETVAGKVLEANLGSGFPEHAFALSVKEGNEIVSATANATVSTYLLGILGTEQLHVGVQSQAGFATNKVEGALVLDNTESMAGGKMDTLRTSAGELVEILMPGDESDSVKIAVVPYSDYVNIGMANRYEDGIHVPDDYAVEKEAGCKKSFPNSTRICKTKVVQDTCYKDGIPYSCQKKKKYDCTGDKGKPVRVCNAHESVDYRWYGCVASRPQPLNTEDDSYATRVPGLMGQENNCDVSEFMRLSGKKGDIQDAIQSMRAVGKTYIPAGLVWGWRALSSNTPFADGAPYSDKTQKVIILMTDGANVRSMKRKKSDEALHNEGGVIWAHGGKDDKKADDEMEKLCENIKDEGITIYTIAFEGGNKHVKKLMTRCAGNGGGYYDVKKKRELKIAFSQIALLLQRLRLTH